MIHIITFQRAAMEGSCQLFHRGEGSGRITHHCSGNWWLIHVLQWDEQAAKNQMKRDWALKRNPNFSWSIFIPSHYRSEFEPSCTELGNMFNRGEVTSRVPFYLTAGSHSDTREKQQEGRGMEAEIAQKDRVTWGRGVSEELWAGYEAQHGCVDEKGQEKNDEDVGRMG